MKKGAAEHLHLKSTMLNEMIKRHASFRAGSAPHMPARATAVMSRPTIPATARKSSPTT